MTASRDPKHLHPALQELWPLLKEAAHAQLGLDIFLTCTYRSNTEQARLYAQGRSTKGRIVTNARPGQSAHNVEPPEGSHAFDFAVSDGRGGATWDSDLYVKVAALARDLGADCGAFWSGFKDPPHIQMPDWHIGKIYGPQYRFIKRQVIPSAPAAEPLPVVEVVDRTGNQVATPYTQATYYGVRFRREPGKVVLLPPESQ